MQKFIHNVALLASLVALAASIWQDWGLWTTVKRMLISYLSFYFFGSFLSLTVLAIPYLERKQPSPGPAKGKNRPAREVKVPVRPR